jgi:predicted transcriptional regulator
MERNTINTGTHDSSPLPASRGTPAGPARSRKAEPPCVGINDSAVRVVCDSTNEHLWTVGKDCGLEEMLDKMARVGVGALLVTHERHVVGLITVEDIKRKRGTRRGANRVADVMTDAGHVPMIDWQTVIGATVNDLLRLLDRTHANHLLVVETESSSFTRVRGLVYRRQLVQRLGVFAILDRGMKSALSHWGPSWGIAR